MRATRATTGVLLLVVALSAGCSGDPDAQPDLAGSATPTAPAATAPPSASTSVAPSATAVPTTGVLVAVVRMSGPLELYRVDRTRRASLLRTLRGPAGGTRTVDVAMTAGDSPTICATWLLSDLGGGPDARSAVLCYAPGASSGTAVRTGEVQPSELALTPDGRRLAWSELSRGENELLLVADLRGSTVSGVRSFRARRGQPADQFLGRGVGDLAWVGSDRLAISEVAESDDGPELRVFDVASPGDRGWLDAPTVEPSEADRKAGWFTYDAVSSVQGSSALAVERTPGLGEPRVPPRAVRIELPSGRITSVLATAGAGRSMTAVSGGPRAVVYMTSGGREGSDIISIRFAGEARGAPVVGLPADVEAVLAQS